MKKVVNGVEMDMTVEEIAVRQAEEKQWQDEQAATKWQRDLAAAWPSVPAQLDYIYENGLDAWKAMIKEIKDRYPPPA